MSETDGPTPESSPESSLESDSAPPYRLRLFVAGSGVRARRAIANMRRICDQYPGKLDLEVIDIYQQPALAKEHQVIAAPTLVKLLPLPLRRIIGDLSETDRVLRGLELEPLPPERHEP